MVSRIGELLKLIVLDDETDICILNIEGRIFYIEYVCPNCFNLYTRKAEPFSIKKHIGWNFDMEKVIEVINDLLEYKQ